MDVLLLMDLSHCCEVIPGGEMLLLLLLLLRLRLGLRLFLFLRENILFACECDIVYECLGIPILFLSMVSGESCC